MASIYDRGIRRRQRSSDEVIRTLEDYVRLLECRYERTSDSMQAAVACGSVAETPEISLWLTRYRALDRLRAQRGSASGTSTPIISTSI